MQEYIAFKEIASGVFKIEQSNVIGYDRNKYVNADTVITLLNAKHIKAEVIKY